MSFPLIRPHYDPAPKRVVAIVNPRSGQGRGQRVLNFLKNYNWPAELTVFETIPDSLEGHLAAIAHAHQWKASRLLVSGGDGTLMETLTAMLKFDFPLPISLIPGGTGNIVAGDLRLPRRLLPAVRQAFSPGILRWWDIGQLKEHQYCFALRASAGYEAIALAATHNEAKSRWGVIAYLVPAIRELFRSPKVKFTLSIDDEEPRNLEGISAFVAVTSRVTGLINLVLSRDIHPDDGILHVGVIHPQKWLRNLPLMLRKAALDARNMISIFPVKHQVKIEADPVQFTQVDGEMLGKTPFIVRNLPGAAPFVIPFRTWQYAHRPVRAIRRRNYHP